MEITATLNELINSPIWVKIVVVILFIAANSSILSKFTDRYSRKRDTQSGTGQGQFNLLKLTRKRHIWIKIFPWIMNVFVLILSIYATVLLNNGKIQNPSILLTTSIYLGVTLPIIFLGDLVFNPPHQVDIDLDGDSDILFRQYQRVMLDMKMSIIELDCGSKRIQAERNGSTITIEITVEDAKNKVKITSTRSFFGILFFSSEYIKIIRALTYLPCYPASIGAQN